MTLQQKVRSATSSSQCTVYRAKITNSFRKYHQTKANTRTMNQAKQVTSHAHVCPRMFPQSRRNCRALSKLIVITGDDSCLRNFAYRFFMKQDTTSCFRSSFGCFCLHCTNNFINRKRMTGLYIIASTNTSHTTGVKNHLPTYCGLLISGFKRHLLKYFAKWSCVYWHRLFVAEVG